jgi:imidazoleglycerol phosphate synthase glutamine amidotransferase subunit HisH
VIAVVDYGAGNTRSVLRALEAAGADARLVATPEGLGAAGRVVFPGVGAALGAQLLLEGSDEGDAPGLGLIGGRCRAFPAADAGGPRQVPHIGWNEVLTRDGVTFDAYFVHGFWPDADPVTVAGRTTVDGFTFPSLLRSGAITGTQFHPEKSGPVGRALLRAFASGLLDAPRAVVAWS